MNDINDTDSSHNYQDILDLDDIQTIAEGILASELRPSVKNSMKERVMNRIMAPCPMGGESSFAAQKEWLRINDKLEVKVLTQDLENKVQTAYWRLAAGAVVPPHYHHNDEDCLVIDGDIRFGDHHLHSGDFHAMKKGTTHPEMTTSNGALLYLKHDIHDDLSWLNA